MPVQPPGTESSIEFNAPSSGSAGSPDSSVPLSATVYGTDQGRYTYEVSFAVSAGATVRRRPSTEAGYARLAWSPHVAGSLSLTNRTTRRAMPLRDWAACGIAEDYCASLYGLWPQSSPVCAAFEPEVRGRWCALKFGQAHLYIPSTTTTLPSNRSVTTGEWRSAPRSVTTGTRKGYARVAAELDAGPKAWEVVRATRLGERTSFADACAAVRYYPRLWSSRPIDCG